ncbi:hypothetical protein ACEN9X_24025 [Mucilaginibacter sp. Mucisp86]|uniref:hypothetical protein n=1 Tax=Mucilaginibacter sp. Mucisp86 TaxID=3243060 RepID=UPI0039B3EFDD
MTVDRIIKGFLFDRNIENLYKQKCDKIEDYVYQLDINSSLTQQQIQILKDGAFKKLWDWPEMGFNKDNMTKDSENVLMSPEDVLEIIYPGRTSIEYSNVLATKISYQFSLNPSTDILTYGIEGSKISFLGKYSKNSLVINIYTDKEIDETIAIEIKAKRDKIISSIEKALEINQKYIDSKASEFKEIIGQEIGRTFNDAKKRSNINSLI